VLPDVDIAKTAAGAARSIFANAGQVCIAGSRLYAHRDIFDQLLEAVAENAGKWKVGPSLAPDTNMGPLVSTEQRERVMDYIDQGKKAGASVLRGGDAPGGPMAAISSAPRSSSTSTRTCRWCGRRFSGRC
jgi:phenylacetaldehyde dehydrogenase